MWRLPDSLLATHRALAVAAISEVSRTVGLSEGTRYAGAAQLCRLLDLQLAAAIRGDIEPVV